MTTEVVFAPTARRDLERLDRQVARRILRAIQRYAASGLGDIARIQGSPGEFRLRVGDWRVRFAQSLVSRPAELPETGEVQVRVIEVLHVLPRGRAYRG